MSITGIQTRWCLPCSNTWKWVFNTVPQDLASSQDVDRPLVLPWIKIMKCKGQNRNLLNISSSDVQSELLLLEEPLGIIVHQPVRQLISKIDGRYFTGQTMIFFLSETPTNLLNLWRKGFFGTFHSINSAFLFPKIFVFPF